VQDLHVVLRNHQLLSLCEIPIIAADSFYTELLLPYYYSLRLGDK